MRCKGGKQPGPGQGWGWGYKTEGLGDPGLRAKISASKGARSPAAGLLLGDQGVVAQQLWSFWPGLELGAHRGPSLESRNPGPEHPLPLTLSLPCRVIYPCQSLCEAVQTSCAPIMACYGYPWPAILHCGCFPAGHGLCVAAISNGSRPSRPRESLHSF